jgi:hypothetical protein
MMIGEWAYAEALNPVFGEAPRCPSCGKLIGMKPWLPPYRARLRKGTRTGTPPDVITGADFDTFIAAERFVAEFERANLKGVERWESIDIRGYNDRDFKLAILPVPPRTCAKLEEMHAVFKGNPPDCPVCCQAFLEDYKGVVINEASWTGADVFQLTNLGDVVMVTDRFAKFIAAGQFTGVPLAPAETFVPSWARRSPE